MKNKTEQYEITEKVLDKHFYHNHYIWTPYKTIERNVLWLEIRTFTIDENGFPTKIDIIELSAYEFQDMVMKYGIEMK
jgi:hypothetical protein